MIQDNDGVVDLAMEQLSQTAVRANYPAPVMPVHLDPLAELGVNKKYYNWDVVSTRKSSLQQQTYGTSSSIYFTRQMIMYMDVCDGTKTPEVCSSQVYTPSESTYHCDASRGCISSGSMVRYRDLSRHTEEVYLSSFWKFSQLTAPILARDSFETYYDALWNHSRALRDPSALVDIMLALCIQYEAQSSPNSPQHQVPENLLGGTPDSAGLWWYRRSQQLLVDDLEEPSIATFQGYLLSVIWLSNAGRHNTAHSVMASAIRIGIILGLHLEPAKSLSFQQREFQKRLWWVTYALEMKFAMELGRPLAINCKQVTCTLPSDNIVVPQLDRKELLFSIHLIKLLLTSRAVYITFYRQCAEELNKSEKESIYEDLEVLEHCAKFMASRIAYLRTWARNVPSVLHIKRKNTQPYCVDSLDFIFDDSFENLANRWNIFLELHYHTMALSLFRPFINFSINHRSIMPYTHQHALSCMKHALAITSILQQMCINSRYFKRFLEVWHWQWSAALTLVGYILAYPDSSTAADARVSIDIALLVLKSCGQYAAAEVICQLIERAASFNPETRRTTGNDTLRCASEQVYTGAINWSEASPSEWDINQSASTIDGAFGSLSTSSTAGDILGSLSALGDLDAADQNVFEFLHFDDLGAL